MKTQMETSYLSLGSNIGDRLDFLTQACQKLNEHENIIVTKISAVYETKAWGLKNQADYYNIAAQITTNLEPYQLLDACQKIEQSLHRIRTLHWGPRTIDIDILLYGAVKIKEPQLTIPHPYMLQREFVTLPLNEIVPDLSISGFVISDLVKNFSEHSTCVKTPHQIELS